jgi:hypothetical protein
MASVARPGRTTRAGASRRPRAQPPAETIG